MYKIKVTYSVIPDGRCRANLEVIEVTGQDAVFDNGIFANGRSNVTHSCYDLQTLERWIEKEIEDARNVVNERRNLLRSIPGERIIEV